MIVVFLVCKIILAILLVLISLLILLLAIILFIPFKYYCAGEKFDSAVLQGYISWLFGGIKMKFNYCSDNGFTMIMNLFGMKKSIDNKDKSSQDRQTEKDKINKEKTKKTAYSYLTKQVIEKGIQTVLKMLNHCKPGKLILNATIGFDDPMYTGLLCGLYSTGNAILDKYQIHLQTTFDDEVLEGNFVIGGRIQIFYLILVAIGFVIAKPFRSILLKNIKLKIKRRLKKWRIASISVKT